MSERDVKRIAELEAELKSYSWGYGFDTPDDMAEEIARLRKQNEALVETLKVALAQSSDSVLFEGRGDFIGTRICCDTLSNAPHKNNCWAIKAQALLEG